jgi:hypothetical protein
MWANVVRFCLSETVGMVAGMSIIHGSAPALPSLHDWTLSLIGAGVGFVAGILIATTWISTAALSESLPRQGPDDRIQRGPGCSHPSSFAERAAPNFSGRHTTSIRAPMYHISLAGEI